MLSVLSPQGKIKGFKMLKKQEFDRTDAVLM